ncbi:hypothetical protein PFLUV_G00244620 [Perca fluviatilis]|uniref:Uncharacterized protein n=1 Tax=Perca fluviatilis TaxID=8168 RepID=A0A6A5E6V3_PERFL|nr:hypothetical protein PFLUV_G00244620 [Perca fluviatilis]
MQGGGGGGGDAGRRREGWELLYCSACGQCSQSIYISTLAPALLFERNALPSQFRCRGVTASHTGTLCRQPTHHPDNYLRFKKCSFSSSLPN